MPTESQLRSIAISLALLAGFAGLAGVLPAQNALSNPELDPPFFALGWRLLYGAELDWTGVDSDGCEGSGSGQLTSAPTDTGAEWAEASQCVTVHPPSWPHGLHGSFSYQSGAATLAYIQFFYYSDSLCGLGGGSYLGLDSAEGPTGPGWHRAEMSVFPLPAGIGSVDVAIGADAGSGAVLEILFDRAYFGGILRLFSDGFEAGGSTCRWSAAVP